METPHNQVIPAYPPDLFAGAITAACSGLAPNSRRAYQRAILNFLAWWQAQPKGLPLNRLLVEQFLEILTPDSVSPAAFNQTLSALKRLASQAAAHGWLDWTSAREIDSLRSRTQRGVRSGIWLSKEQATALLAHPDQATLTGLRDLVVLALLIGCGLRRSEVCNLSFEHLQTIDSRLHIVNLVGKGDRVRTIQVPEWIADILHSWRLQSGLTSGPVVRSFKADGTLNGTLSPSGIWLIVTEYSAQLGSNCSPHDLRRTFAKLARKGGAPLEVLQRTLGHASLVTTERYVNAGEEANAGDYLKL